MRALLRAGLIDGFVLSLVPVLLGRGKRLFDDAPPGSLRLVRSRPGDGVLHLSYDVVRASPRAQSLRVLDGRDVLDRVSDVREVVVDAGPLALVLGPDGGATMRRSDTAADAWVALWNGDDAHDPEATGMLSAVVGPLAADEVPVWTAAGYDGDVILVPADRLDHARAALRRAGHRVT